ncbi:hypothetical protein GDO81_010139 [Engystomops pustulosus]|uniref:Uncharacterized protein n=1 Tax=Engystomops pustulosus TaxID=76066 RepID=A0AAV7BY08_ENGPU|nr:hypothetical protein GDO81_010139 [Engystomops pustulosus]
MLCRFQMNSSRRIHSLRAHRQRIPITYVDAWQKQPCSCTDQWCIDELATYLLISMIILIALIALLGAWARKEVYV